MYVVNTYRCMLLADPTHALPQGTAAEQPPEDEFSFTMI